MKLKAVSGIMLILLLIGMLALAFDIQPVKAQLETIYIRTDGSVDPPTANITSVDNVTYYFTDNNHDEIVVERNNIVIDGDGCTLQGTGVSESKGIDLSGRTNVTVRNTKIKNFWDAIYLWESSSNSISDNNITNNSICGIWLGYSSNNSIIGNNITNNVNGILLYYSSNNSISENNITAKSIYAIYGIWLGYSSNNSISKNNIADNYKGIGLYSSSNYNSVSGNKITNNVNGILLDSSSNNSISENNITNNKYGIVLDYSCNYNSVSDNNITANNYYGILLYSSSSNSISENNIKTNHIKGIVLDSSSSNSIIGNNITNNKYGIQLEYSSNYNRVSENNITANNGYGIRLAKSSDNIIYHNNFDNAQQVNVTSSGYLNVWDDDYPSGGNYWSDYNGTDANHDGIGDAAYFIDANNTDNYPLMGTFNSYNVTYFTPPLVPHACNVTVISNSTISDFGAPIWIEHPEDIFLMFNPSGAEGSTGFCRVSFPTAMINGTYHVSVNGTEIPYTLLPCSDANYSYLYFTYTHPTKTVIITPEFPSILILPLFMMATLLAVIIYRRKHAM